MLWSTLGKLYIFSVFRRFFVIEIETLSFGENFDRTRNFFHPAFVPLTGGGILFTFQLIMESDCYGPPQYMLYSPEGGWSEAAVIPGMENVNMGNGLVQGVADIRPFAAADGTVAVFGCSTVYFRNKIKSDYMDIAQYSVYNTYHPDKGWGKCGVLSGVRTACTQAEFDNCGNWLIPCYFDKNLSDASANYVVKVLKLHLEGEKFSVIGESNELEYNVERGFIEPSIIFFKGFFYMTIRAEDGFGYVSKTADPMHWDKPKVWKFDNSELRTSTTQQHFFKMKDRLFLCYTRKTRDNEHVFRYRAPLFAAEIDTEKCCLKKSTETTVFPLTEYQKSTGLYGNFHTVSMPDGSVWLSDGRLFVISGEDNNDYLKSEMTAVKITLH